MELEINGVIVDLSESKPLLLSFAVNELGSLETRQGNQSNDFELLLTSKTKSALGYSNNINSINDINPQTKIPAKVLDKREIVDLGYIQITEINYAENLAVCSFFGGNSDWYSLVKDIKLQDIDLSDFAHIWNKESVIASFDNTAGYIYPLIDYGRLNETVYNETLITDWICANFVSTVLARAFQAIKWKLAGQFINTTKYRKLLLPYSNEGAPQISESYLNGQNLTAQIVVDTPIYNSFDFIPLGLIPFPDVISGNRAGNWNVDKYTFGQEKQRFKVELELITDSTFNCSIFVDTILNIQLISFVAGQPTKITFDFETNVGGFGYWQIFLIDLLIPAGDLITTLLAGSTAKITRLPDIYEGNLVYPNWFLPDSLTVSDWLITLCYQYGLFFQADIFAKTVTVFQFENLSRNKINAIDWSNKVDYKGIKSVNFTEIVQNYGQNSHLVYTLPDDDRLLQDYSFRNLLNFGDGTIRIENEFLDLSVNIIESKFSATINYRAFNGVIYVPFIPIYSENIDGIFDADLNPEYRMLLLAENTSLDNISTTTSTQISITDENGTEIITSVPFTYFFKTVLNNDLDNYKDSLAFDVPNIQAPNDTALIEKNYQGLTRVLNNVKYLKLDVLLKPTDINSLDFSKPIFLNIQTIGITISGYFFLNLVSEFSGGSELTEVELIQLR